MSAGRNRYVQDIGIAAAEANYRSKAEVQFFAKRSFNNQDHRLQCSAAEVPSDVAPYMYFLSAIYRLLFEVIWRSVWQTNGEIR